MNEREPYKIDQERLELENELARMVREDRGVMRVIFRFAKYTTDDLKRFGYTGQRLKDKIRGLSFEMSWHARSRKEKNGLVRRHFESLHELLSDPQAEVPALILDDNDLDEPDKMGDREPRVPKKPLFSGSVKLNLPK